MLKNSTDPIANEHGCNTYRFSNIITSLQISIQCQIQKLIQVKLIAPFQYIPSCPIPSRLSPKLRNQMAAPDNVVEANNSRFSKIRIGIAPYFPHLVILFAAGLKTTEPFHIRNRSWMVGCDYGRNGKDSTNLCDSWDSCRIIGVNRCWEQ